MGGIVSGISEGMIQKKVSQQAYEFEKGIQSGEYKKVGKTPGREDEGADVDLHRYNEAWAQSSKDSLAEVKRTRHEKAVADSLRSLEKAAKGKDNVMPPLVECCKAFATVGEMADVFRQVFGEWQEPVFY
jgi:methylmalonyl-CoA mutase N-terminal domain/subunit